MVSLNTLPNTGTRELASELVPSVLTIDSLKLGPLSVITLVSTCLILDVDRDFGDNWNFPFLGLVTFNCDESHSP